MACLCGAGRHCRPRFSVRPRCRERLPTAAATGSVRRVPRRWPDRAGRCIGNDPRGARLAGDVASHLAYYAFRSVGVLAPRSWRCFGLYGSDTDILFVTPDPHGFEDLRAAAPKLQGPVVVIARHSGETSGRFEVAAVAARLFPAARHFVHKVIAENIVAASHFHFAPYKTDTVRRLSSTVAEFVTPPNREGLGTSGRIAANDQPVAGVAIWLPDQGNDLVMTLVRLDPDLRREVRTILTQTERTLGSPELVGRGK